MLKFEANAVIGQEAGYGAWKIAVIARYFVTA